MKTILCFGDSNTWGHNPVDCSKLKKPWPEILTELMPEDEIIQNGLCGRTSAFDISEAGKNGLTSFKELFDNGLYADLIIIMLGTNDTLKEADKTPQESTAAIKEYIHIIRKNLPECKTLVISPVHIKECSLTHPIFGELYTKRSVDSSLNTAAEYKKLADEENVYFMNAAIYAQASDIDGIHMVPEEHEKLAKAVFDKINNIFS